MKTAYLKLNRFKSLSRVLDMHPDAFEGKSDILAAKESFAVTTQNLDELISSLAHPVTFLLRTGIEIRKQLLTEFRRMCELGVLIAVKYSDNEMLRTMKTYKRMSFGIASYLLPQNAINLAAMLEPYADDAAVIGFTMEEINGFRALASDYQSALQNRREQLDDRRNARSNMNNLVKECNAILRRSIDPFVYFNAGAFPDLVSQYRLIRKGSSKRKANNTESSLLVEISGTVTDSVTGLPIANAVINLAAPETILTTDEDGCYALDDLEAGDLTLSCHYEGYVSASPVRVTAVAGDSLVVDFALVPAQQQAAA